jgi:hypothetical protein
MTVRSDPIFTNSQEILVQILTVLKQKEMLSWKCHESMILPESTVIVNWSYNYQIVKGSFDKYNLNKDYVKEQHKRLCSFIGTIVTGFTKNAHSSMHTFASKDTNGMIGHLFIFKK